MTLPIYPGNIVTVRTNDPAVAGSGFKNAAGVLTDPTVVTFKWAPHRSNPAEQVAATTTYTWTVAVPGTDIVKDSVGVFHVDISIIESGLHYFAWSGSGAVVARAPEWFTVAHDRLWLAP